MLMILPTGSLMIDIAGYELTDLERERLAHPLVGGVILFSRNYQSPAQLAALTAEIHSLCFPPLLIATDHEGGRVQRCREGFTRLPPMRRLGEWWDSDAAAALEAARSIGYVLAAELRSCGVDLSFTPVLDLDWGRSSVIGDRAFHADPQAVIALAGALITGMRQAGMAACGKHFPGHGWAEADSHHQLPVDTRTLAELAPDIEPYRQLPLDAVMPAHVVYTSFDKNTSCFSSKWNDLLRNEINFSGVVFSDDLSMQAAGVVGDVVARVEAAWQAGCDMLLICNAPDDVGEVLARGKPEVDLVRMRRIARLLPGGSCLPDFRQTPCYLAGVEAAEMLNTPC